MSAPGAAAATPPGRIWYLVALAIFIAGMATMAIFLLTRLTGMEDGMVRVVVPGEHRLALAAGTYTIFHETESVIDGKIYSSSGLSGLTVSVTAPDGATVPLTAASSGRYSFSGHTGFAVFDFAAPTAGDYTLAGRYDDGATGPETVLAVGAGFLSAILGTVFGALAFAFGGAILATIIMVGTLVKRRRAGLRF
jgi:hypothetical protein